MTNPFERLEELTDVAIEMGRDCDGIWQVSIRPYVGGFPLVRGESENLPEAVKQAVELWETK